MNVYGETPTLEINGIKFTVREMDIVACLINGASVKRIAILLSVSPRTVETHMSRLMSKLGTIQELE